LADFGLSKLMSSPDDRTTTMCGTPGYLAPEVLQAQPYGTSVDYWSLGVLIFEMSAGINPFLAQSTHQTLKNILTLKISFPEYFDNNTRDLLRALLQRDPDKRLCVPDELRAHAYFKGVNWHKLSTKRAKNPFKIFLRSDTDTQYFDSSYTNQSIELDDDETALSTLSSIGNDDDTDWDQSTASSSDAATPRTAVERFGDFEWSSPDILH
jgi:serine/threonine protein kinase